MVIWKKINQKGAISIFNKILKQEPKNIEALFNKGLALNQMEKKYSDAITCFDIILEINPKDSQAWNNSIAMAENGNIQAAAIGYDKAIEADPKNASAHFNIKLSQTFISNIIFEKLWDCSVTKKK